MSLFENSIHGKCLVWMTSPTTCSSSVHYTATFIFPTSLTSFFPAAWKQARVQPVFKQNGDRSSPGSYRHIAVLCSVSKVFDTLAKDQVLKFCLANRVLPDCQFGFLHGRSTVWQLLSVLDDWHVAKEKGISIHATFLDLAKAFDRVNHPFLTKKLATSGLSPTCVVWFKSYLTEQTIMTAVDHVDSSPFCICSGVPQGSATRPLVCPRLRPCAPARAPRLLLPCASSPSALRFTDSSPVSAITTSQRSRFAFATSTMACMLGSIPPLAGPLFTDMLSIMHQLIRPCVPLSARLSGPATFSWWHGSGLMLGASVSGMDRHSTVFTIFND